MNKMVNFGRLIPIISIVFVKLVESREGKVTRRMSQMEHWENVLKPLEEIYGEAFAEDWAIMKTLSETAISPRALGAGLRASTSPLLAAINPYGCWCNFQDMPSPFKGEPVDAIDRACKVLQEGMRCIQIDLGKPCADISEEYNIAPTQHKDFRDQVKLIAGVTSECNNQNPGDSCGTNLCIVEGYFVNELMRLIMTGTRLDLKNSHRMGFDPLAHCEKRIDTFLYSDYYTGYDGGFYPDYSEDTPKDSLGDSSIEGLSGDLSLFDAIAAPSGPKDIPDTCCGVYPVRAPFNPGFPMTKGCCDKSGTIYSTTTHVCCDDGRTRQFGDC